MTTEDIIIVIKYVLKNGIFQCLFNDEYFFKLLMYFFVAQIL